jgi:hypothetical protein
MDVFSQLRWPGEMVSAAASSKSAVARLLSVRAVSEGELRRSLRWGDGAVAHEHETLGLLRTGVLTGRRPAPTRESPVLTIGHDRDAINRP